MQTVSKTELKNHLTIYRLVFAIMPHSFIIKPQRYERWMEYVLIKAIYDNPIANIMLNGEKTQNIPTRSRNKERISTLPNVFNAVFEVFAKSVRHEKEINRY